MKSFKYSTAVLSGREQYIIFPSKQVIVEHPRTCPAMSSLSRVYARNKLSAMIIAVSLENVFDRRVLIASYR